MSYPSNLYMYIYIYIYIHFILQQQPLTMSYRGAGPTSRHRDRGLLRQRATAVPAHKQRS